MIPNKLCACCALLVNTSTAHSPLAVSHVQLAQLKLNPESPHVMHVYLASTPMYQVSLHVSTADLGMPAPLLALSPAQHVLLVHIKESRGRPVVPFVQLALSRLNPVWMPAHCVILVISRLMLEPPTVASVQLEPIKDCPDKTIAHLVDQEQPQHHWEQQNVKLVLLDHIKTTLDKHNAYHAQVALHRHCLANRHVPLVLLVHSWPAQVPSHVSCVILGTCPYLPVPRLALLVLAVRIRLKRVNPPVPHVPLVQPPPIQA
jgi:hypothetical protein